MGDSRVEASTAPPRQGCFTRTSPKVRRHLSSITTRLQGRLGGSAIAGSVRGFGRFVVMSLAMSAKPVGTASLGTCQIVLPDRRGPAQSLPAPHEGITSHSNRG